MTFIIYVNIYLQRGKALYALSRYKRAALDFSLYLKTHPADLSVLKLRADIWDALGEEERAAADRRGRRPVKRPVSVAEDAQQQTETSD